MNQMTVQQNTPPATGRCFWLLPAVVFGFLWFTLINRLRIAWTNEPQYSYGWAVPFLCLYLAWERLQKFENGKQKADTGGKKPEGEGRRAAFSIFNFQSLLLF